LRLKLHQEGFQPVRTARIKLNGNKVAEIVWPAIAIVNAAVELDASNSIELELDGPAFGSVEFTIRGASRTIK